MNIPRMSEEALKKFVVDFCSNLLFTSAHVPPHDHDLLPSLFMPIVFGAFADATKEEYAQLGIVYEYYAHPETGRSQVFPRSINGYPIFMSMRMMHVLDWEIAFNAIKRQREKLEQVEL